MALPLIPVVYSFFFFAAVILTLHTHYCAIPLYPLSRLICYLVDLPTHASYILSVFLCYRV